MIITFPRVYTLSPHPRPGRHVFNAPRPLPGDDMWEGEPLNGTHYCTVGMRLPESDAVLQQIRDLGAACVAYPSEDACMLRGRSVARRSGLVLASMFTDEIVALGVQSFNEDATPYELNTDIEVG